mmetsp:Transcript_158593/g.280089  ORF Transcript_158593/g.280089 Transcript_158593/m.280089 type:complete len:90 (+) Transcript_158593:1146-1415(+)
MSNSMSSLILQSIVNLRRSRELTFDLRGTVLTSFASLGGGSSSAIEDIHARRREVVLRFQIIPTQCRDDRSPPQAQGDAGRGPRDPCNQ